MGKGSVPRPFSVSRKQFANNFDLVFARAKPIALCRQGSDEVLAYACGKCGIVAASELSHGEEAFEEAKNHCGPWFCEKCGNEKQSRYVCRACIDEHWRQKREKQWNEAKDVSDCYDGPVSDGDEGYWPSPDEASYDLDEPTWLFACTEQGLGRVDLVDLLERLLDEHHEDAEECLVEVDELQAYLDAWVAKQTRLVTWHADYTRKLLVVPDGWPDEEDDER